MKKILSVLLISSMLLSLYACSNNKVLVSNPDEIIIKGENDKETLTKQELFEKMKLGDYSSIILNDLLVKIAQKEGIDKEKLQKDIQSEIIEIKAIYGDNYLNLLDYYGGEDGLNTLIMANLCSTELSKIYFDLNYDALIKEYAPIKAQMAYFNTKDDAENFLNACNTDSSFDIAAINHGYTSSTQAKIYTDKDALAIEVKEYLNNSPKLGLSNIIETMVTTTDASGNTSSNIRYYVLNIIDLDVNSFKEEFKDLLSTNNYISQNDILNYFFAKYEIKFYDQRTYELMSSLYAGLK